MTSDRECGFCGYTGEAREDGPSTIRCGRCDSLLWKKRANTAERSLALALTGVLFFIPALAYPIMAFEVVGRSNDNLLMTGVLGLADGGALPIALIVFLTSIFIPFARFAVVALITFPIVTGRPGACPRRLLPLAHICNEWSLLDVYLLGVAVTYAKLSNFGAVSFEPGWIPLLGIILSSIALTRSYDAIEIERLTRPPEENSATGALVRKSRPRRNRSVPLALLIATALLIVPAYSTPILMLVQYGDAEHATVYGSVLELTAGGQYLVGSLMFIASIVVPIAKLAVLSLLMLSVRIGMKRWRQQRLEIYKFIKGIGRWSFVDFFVVSLLIALADLGVLATASAEPGLLLFAGVVICVMFAAELLDPREFWDGADRAPAPAQTPLTPSPA